MSADSFRIQEIDNLGPDDVVNWLYNKNLDLKEKQNLLSK